MRYRETGAPFEARCVGCLPIDLGTRKPNEHFAGLLEQVSRELDPRGGPYVTGVFI